MTASQPLKGYTPNPLMQYALSSSSSHALFQESNRDSTLRPEANEMTLQAPAGAPVHTLGV